MGFEESEREKMRRQQLGGARRRWEKPGEDEQLTEREEVRWLSNSMGVGDEVHEVA